jgi:prepilin-type N-terminal cleavage/methylation domain-containing protein/prepilin-type processing-associated H-X9-DG protein
MNGSSAHLRVAAGRGFTLVELLVVLGIISVLCGVLLAAVASSREKARATACRSNLNQLGVAMRLYGDDWGDYFPYDVRPRFRPSVLEDPPKMAGPMIHEDPTDPDSNRWDAAPLLPVLRPYLAGEAGVWFCPDMNRRVAEVGDGTNYEVNACLVVNTMPMSGRPRRGAVAYRNVKTPVVTLVFQDHYTEGTRVHDGGRNFACVDGHVQWQRQGQTVVRAGWWW